jgi:hypothetical protein
MQRGSLAVPWPTAAPSSAQQDTEKGTDKGFAGQAEGPDEHTGTVEQAVFTPDSVSLSDTRWL